MNKRFLSVFVFALVVSAVASLLLYRVISSKIATSAKAPTNRVIVAARTLPIGTLIRDMDIKVVDWTGPVPAQAIPNQEDVIGRGVIADIIEGEPILNVRLAAKGAGAGLAATIPNGMRAVAVRVNEVVGLAGFVVPGMRVDVLISGNPPSSPAALGTRTKTLLQNIEVLSAGQNIQKDAEGKPIAVQVVNLLVTPEQAETLSLASNDTRIQLVLRNPLDTKEAKPPGTALALLFNDQRLKPEVSSRPTVRRAPKVSPVVPPKAEPKPAPLIIEVLHGSTRAEAKFQQ